MKRKSITDSDNRQKAALERQRLLAELDPLKTASMHRSAPVPQDLPPPNGFKDLTRGWSYSDYISWEGAGKIYKACSSSVYHGDGWEKTSTQNPLSMYSTELLATKALRHALAETFAEWLVKWDARIAELEKENGE